MSEAFAGEVVLDRLLETFAAAEVDRVAERCEALRREHLMFCSHELRAVLDEARDEGLSRALLGLPGPALLRLLGAPETLAHLLAFHRGHRKPALAFLARAVEAERARDSRSAPRRPCWTALGDLHLRAEGSSYGAPRIDALIIDCRSPFARRPPSVGDALPQLDAGPTTDDDEAIVAKLGQALDALELVSPGAHALVVGSLITILPRKAARAEAGFTSASSRPRTGRATLFDADCPGVSTARIAAALVHEAIHSYLYRLEQSVDLVSSPRAAIERTLHSPWTGSELRLNTYVHACFVYFALVNLWRRPEARRFFDAAQVDELAAMAASGFAGGEHLARLESHRAYLHEAVDAQLVGMQGWVR
ncbi:hypothetical protein ENSA5_08630 [Enhygromyxa salina]|uniref:HEXXH motif domain protein n=1 Tax=Enhygromyxa salina TaxID=215803 RepID=A0A2S9YH19_9BACT|nr:HEXXH motif-containing putative peptide modification protein [Enhygromyxa salina]PRQ04332.1 hypothetical protein ENSA5_08630 [Enhygromyxa salina]